MDKTAAYMVPAVEKSISVIEYITNSNKGRSMRDVYSSLGIAKTTAFSILQTLVHCGLINKTIDGLYVPTLKITAIGLKARELNESIHLLRPPLEKLRDKVGFTVFLCVYDNGEQIVLEKLDGFSSVTFKAYPGQRKKINTSGSGKAIAAYLSTKELQLVLDKGLDNLTANSIYTEADFLLHLDKIRRQGYAVDDNEGEMGIRCIGAPVFMYDDRLYGAISISALSESLPVSSIPEYAKILLEVSTEVSRSLGYTGGQSVNTPV